MADMAIDYGTGAKVSKQRFCICIKITVIFISISVKSMFSCDNQDKINVLKARSASTSAGRKRRVNTSILKSEYLRYDNNGRSANASEQLKAVVNVV